MNYILSDIVVACIREAASSGKKLSWTLKEDNHGVLVHLVLKSARMLSPALAKWALIYILVWMVVCIPE